ncbi:MAG: glycoside hydrolase [Candidatus Aminicenantes bacterium RBG_16_63_16]|nr:MAG: glycoside hydrolase [Candidatus Aminicenantes bacterium RBG_16_63_16]
MKTRKIILTAAVLAFLTMVVPVWSQPARILVNQVGYDPAGSKNAVVQGQLGDTFDTFTVRELATGTAALAGKVRTVGPVQKWKDWVFGTIDFSAVTKEGSYVIEVATGRGTVTSHLLTIQKNALERNTLSDVIYYFKGQRCSGPWDKADRAMRFEGRDGVVDVHGGWFDASGDYGKHLSHLSFSTFFNPQQISLTAWSLFESLRELDRRADPNFVQYKKRLLDEALFGADYLVRIKNPQGSFYITVSARGPEKRPEDRLITPKATRHIILTTETKDKFRDYGRERELNEAAHEAGYREGAGLCIAALAMASTSKVSGDFGSADYLRAAEDAFAFLEKSNSRFLNDGKENILDDACALLAAVELLRATGKPIYREAMDRRARRLEARLMTDGAHVNYWRADDGTRPFFHPVDAGLPVVSLLQYTEVAGQPERARALDIVRKSLEHELAVTAEVANPFGYSRQLVQDKTGARRTSFFFPHNTETEPWWQGENARLGSMAAAARLAVRHYAADTKFGRQLEAFSRDQLNWILGLNPYDSCMMQGKGRNNPAYMFFDSYEYTNVPGGIVNGITAGVKDEQDIDYYLHFAQTGKDDDWRWAEQWLPHAAWYLYAVTLGTN